MKVVVLLLTIMLPLPAGEGGAERRVRGAPHPPFGHLLPVGEGAYRNPIIFADYSDPDAIRVGDDYYLAASSFQCVPGLPILHSRDLVHWTILAHAVDRLPSDFDRPQHGNTLAVRHVRAGVHGVVVVV